MTENYRILIIDDVESIHQDFRKILLPREESYSSLDEINAKLFGKQQETKNKLPAFEIDSAYQGRGGLACIEKAIAQGKPYALMFVDVQMPPGEDGIETISKIWKIDNEIQTVICTAFAKYNWEELLQRFGNTDRLFVLKKPFDVLEVIQLARSLTKRWNQNHSVNEKMAMYKRAPNSSLKKSTNSLQNAIETLSAINKKLNNQ